MKKIIAIDGTSASGKSTLGKNIARTLGYNFIDSGALYRVFGYLGLKNQIDMTNEKNLDDFIEKAKRIRLMYNFDFKKEDVEIFLNGKNISPCLRSREVSNFVPFMSSDERLRSIVNEKIKELSKTKSSVIDGRDIGTVVFPDADIKFFVSAPLEVRAQRRKKDLPEEAFEDIKKDLEKRDFADRTRKTGALKKAEDAIEIDTSKYNINQLLNHCLEIIKTQNV